MWFLGVVVILFNAILYYQDPLVVGRTVKVFQSYEYREQLSNQEFLHDILHQPRSVPFPPLAALHYYWVGIATRMFHSMRDFVRFYVY